MWGRGPAAQNLPVYLDVVQPAPAQSVVLNLFSHEKDSLTGALLAVAGFCLAPERTEGKGMGVQVILRLWQPRMGLEQVHSL
jgi:hypothetical protein